MSDGPRYGTYCDAGDPNDPRAIGLQWIVSGSRVLEIGCGHGAVTRLLAARRCEVVASDVDPECAASLAGTAQRFVAGDVDDERCRRELCGDYDYVVLMDVLEHLPDPAETLRALAQTVAVGARFVITLPNVLVWHVRVPMLFGQFRYTETGTLDRTHLRFFTPETAAELVRSSGLAPVRSQITWNVPYLGPIWSVARAAELDRLPERVRRRFGWIAPLVLGALLAQRALNRVGYLELVQHTGAAIGHTFPGLFGNHVVLLTGPAATTEAAHA